MVRDLRGVVEREKASIGLFITLAEATKPMRDEALKAGFYTSSQGSNFPKLQILTIEGLLGNCERPKYPDPSLGALTFKKSRLEQGSTVQGELFGDHTRPDNVEPIARRRRGDGSNRKVAMRATETLAPEKRHTKASKAQ
jgi:hypothetical protein